MPEFSTAHATVTTTATAVVTWTRTGNPFSVLVRNVHPTVEAYIGPDSSVTTGTGYYVGPEAEQEIRVPAAEPGVAATTESLYAIAPSGSVPVTALVQPS